MIDSVYEVYQPQFFLFFYALKKPCHAVTYTNRYYNSIARKYFVMIQKVQECRSSGEVDARWQQCGEIMSEFPCVPT